MNTWKVDVLLVEEGDITKADAVITGGKRDLRATGVARRNPHDASVPEIGDELAVARALSNLAHQLLERSAQDIEAITHKPTHLTR
jgi:hypothetical protein